MAVRTMFRTGASTNAWKRAEYPRCREPAHLHHLGRGRVCRSRWPAREPSSAFAGHGLARRGLFGGRANAQKTLHLATATADVSLFAPKYGTLCYSVVTNACIWRIFLASRAVLVFRERSLGPPRSGREPTSGAGARGANIQFYSITNGKYAEKK